MTGFVHMHCQHYRHHSRATERSHGNDRRLRLRCWRKDRYCWGI